MVVVFVMIIVFVTIIVLITIIVLVTTVVAKAMSLQPLRLACPCYWSMKRSYTAAEDC
jgi:hypothetical protein